jgi:hypothetical protein
MTGVDWFRRDLTMSNLGRFPLGAPVLHAAMNDPADARP